MATNASQSAATKKNKLTQTFLATMLVAVFVFGSVGVGAFANEAAANFKTDALQTTETKARRRILSYLQKKEPVHAAAAKVSCEGISLDPSAHNGEFLSRTITIDVNQEQKYKVSLYVKNTGTSAWLGDASGCSEKPLMRLGTARSHDHKSALYNAADPAWRGANRIAMKESRVEPGEIGTFTFTSIAAKKDDIYKEFFQPVVEKVGWLEDKNATLAMEVRVGTYNDDLLYKAFLLNYSARASTLDITGQPTVDVNLTTQNVKVVFGDVVVREYVGSTGAKNTPTPPGRFKIIEKNELRIGKKAPHYRMPHFQMLTPKGVGFHALPYLANDKGLFWKEALSNIGRRVSHGCIRLLPNDAEELFSITPLGTEVVIHY